MMIRASSIGRSEPVKSRGGMTGVQQIFVFFLQVINSFQTRMASRAIERSHQGVQALMGVLLALTAGGWIVSQRRPVTDNIPLDHVFETAPPKEDSISGVPLPLSIRVLRVTGWLLIAFAILQLALTASFVHPKTTRTRRAALIHAAYGVSCVSLIALTVFGAARLRLPMGWSGGAVSAMRCLIFSQILGGITGILALRGSTVEQGRTIGRHAVIIASIILGATVWVKFLSHRSIRAARSLFDDPKQPRSTDDMIVRIVAVVLTLLVGVAAVFYGHTLRWVGDASPQEGARNERHLRITIVVLGTVFLGAVIWLAQATAGRFVDSVGKNPIEGIISFLMERDQTHHHLVLAKAGFIVFLMFVACINAYTRFMTTKPGAFVGEMILMMVSGVLILAGILFLFRRAQSWPPGSYDDTAKRAFRSNLWNCFLFGIVSVVFYLLTEWAGMNAVGFTVLPAQPPEKDCESKEDSPDPAIEEVRRLNRRLTVQILGCIVVVGVAIAVVGLFVLCGRSLGYYQTLIRSRQYSTEFDRFYATARREFMKATTEPVTGSSWYTRTFGDATVLEPSQPRDTASMLMEGLWFGFFFNIAYLLVAYDRNDRSQTRRATFWAESMVVDVLIPTFLFAIAYVVLIATGTMDMFMSRVPPSPPAQIQMTTMIPSTKV